jgi:molecular chaperone GrpE
MNSNNNSQNAEDLSSKGFEFDDSSSIDDFIKELEEKERDLHISPQMVIEIDAGDFDGDDLPEYVQEEIAAAVKPQGNKAQPANRAATGGLETEVTELQAQISKNETERADLVKLMQRRQTDFENYKKRIERERNDTFLNILSGLATQMLPVLDNMNRALDSVSNLSDDTREQDVRHFFDGIVLVNQQLNEVLSEMGVEPIAAVGESFDPHYHEAVAAEETDEFPPHTVTAEFLRGYRIGSKVVRPAMVKVSK